MDGDLQRSEAGRNGLIRYRTCARLESTVSGEGLEVRVHADPVTLSLVKFSSAIANAGKTFYAVYKGAKRKRWETFIRNLGSVSDEMSDAERLAVLYSDPVLERYDSDFKAEAAQGLEGISDRSIYAFPILYAYWGGLNRGPRSPVRRLDTLRPLIHVGCHCLRRLGLVEFVGAFHAVAAARDSERCDYDGDDRLSDAHGGYLKYRSGGVAAVVVIGFLASELPMSDRGREAQWRDSSLMPASWNRLVAWLEQIDALRQAA